jgi:ribosome maturation factor RimP
MASKTVEIVAERISPIIESMGYEVVEIEYVKRNDGMNLTFYIDKMGGITVDDCEKVHKMIDGPLDDINPTNDAKYILNVSSLGLDRPIKTDRDLKRNLGKIVDIKLYKPLFDTKKKEYTGKLLDFDAENVRILLNQEDQKRKKLSEESLAKEITLPRNMIGNMILHLDF